ncbi:hypothetical protein IV203_034075 [Nitzschia inconspicua]|uniref:PH domain-containing protein n=1 Tax=Nitzschia inconspicua TaxID=303405 RepID=A0A9K3M742_9STRA|nr:hypothetical protein IV203_034075 [Nitzschia inconspicua]
MTLLKPRSIDSSMTSGGGVASTMAQQQQQQQQSSSLNPQQQQHMIQLLQASIRCVHSGVFHPVLYQTLGALHQYVGLLQAGFLSGGSSPTLSSSSHLPPPPPPISRPAFYLVKNDTKNDQMKEQEEKKNANNNNNKDGVKKNHPEQEHTHQEEEEKEDAVAYGWVQLLSSSKDDNDDDDDDDDAVLVVNEPSWKPVLALLVQKDKDDEPCLWITREVVVTHSTSTQTNQSQRYRPSTKLETLHSIPLWRRLQSCRYQNFYGDHRIVMTLRQPRTNRQTHNNVIVIQCPTAQDAHDWVQQIQWWKTKKDRPENNNNNNNKSDGYNINQNDNIEVEMVDTLDSRQQQQENQYVTVIVADEVNRGESGSSIPDNDDDDDDNMTSETGTQKRLAERLQEEEDIKRAQRDARDFDEREKKLRQEEEKLKHEQQQSASKATRTDLTRVEREQQARKRAEEARRRKELEYEREKLEREKRRRQELELQRQKAREEQKKKELLQKQKFLQSEEKKEKLKAQAAAVTQTTIVDSGVFGAATTKPTKPPQVAARSVSSPTSNTNNASNKNAANIKAKTPPATKSNKGTDSLWFSLDQQMSAFEAADAERRKADEAKRKLEEEKKIKAEQERRAKLGLDETSEDPEEVRKRIAEQARQRLVQEDIARHSPIKPTASILVEDSVDRPAPPLHSQPRPATVGPIPPNPLASYQGNPPSLPPQQQQYPHQSTNTQAQHAQWQQQQQQHQHTQGSYPLHANQGGRHGLHQDTRHNTQSTQQHQQNQYQYHHSRNTPAVNPPHSSGHHQHQNHYQRQQQQQQQQQQWPHHQSTPSHAAPPHPDTQAHRMHHSVANEKYAAMANQSDDGQASTTRIKHAILIQWALQPPQLQLLRPIEDLITTMHQVFPPALGVPEHEYFTRWKAITSADISDGEKLKKVVRKEVRFFLHPDKLPHDFSEEQRFTCKLLWDIISDSYEDYEKGKEDLDWIK